MDVETLKKELKEIVAKGVTKGEIEKATHTAENWLSGFLNGYRVIGKIRFARLVQYVENYKKRKIVLVDDGDGQWLVRNEDGTERRCSIVWEDEKRAQEQAGNDHLKRQIEAIKQEKIPKERDTAIGRKIWEKEQQNKISELFKQIK